MHFWCGFIGEPNLQLKSRENSCEFEIEPITRYLSGAWTPFKILKRMYSVRSIEHQVCAAEIQNICSGEYWCNPGRRFSIPFFFVHFLYALYENLSPPLSAMFSPWELMPFICKKNVFQLLFYFFKLGRVSLT